MAEVAVRRIAAAAGCIRPHCRIAVRCIEARHTGVPAGRSRVRRIAVPAGRNHSDRRSRNRHIAGPAAGSADYIGWGPSLDYPFGK